MNPTHQDRLAAVTAAIIESVPELREKWAWGFTLDDGHLTLEDVLLWLKSFRPDYTVYWSGPSNDQKLTFGDRVPSMDTDMEEWDVTAGYWTPRLPLHQQPPETIAFLHSVLCP